MDSLLIKGATPLSGEVRVSGAKNACLPMFAAALLTDEKCVLKNVPNLSDVRFMADIVRAVGAEVSNPSEGVWEICAKNLSHIAPYELVRKMRASICLLGPLSARMKKAEVSLPGGCVIGARPVDLHIKGLQAMGAQIELNEGYIHAVAPAGGRLRGARILMEKVSVTGTENLMMAAALADGTTVIENAAREPEIVDLAVCLRMMGAKVSGDGSEKIVIEGVQKLHGGEHSIVADRIEAGTYLIAGMATRGRVICHNTKPEDLDPVLDKIRLAGAYIEIDGNSILLDMTNRRIKPVDIITAPHPGFPTDMQAQFTVLNALAEGESKVTETIFENRFMHIPELNRMGAQIKIVGNTVFISGRPMLKGAQVMATDLRASASLVIAGLVAQGTTIVDRIYHMDRGYEHIERKIRGLGGTIERIKGNV